MFHTTLRLVPCTTLKYTSTSLDHCTQHPENLSGNALHQSQQPYHNHLCTPFCPIFIRPPTHPAPNTHTGPSGLNPSFHWLVHYFMCPPLLFHQQSSAFQLCGHSSTHFVNPPVRQPPDPPPALASWHWSPGVLCAPLEWPCWALPSSYWLHAVHPKCGIFDKIHAKALQSRPAPLLFTCQGLFR